MSKAERNRRRELAQKVAIKAPDNEGPMDIATAKIDVNCDRSEGGMVALKSSKLR